MRWNDVPDGLAMRRCNEGLLERRRGGITIRARVIKAREIL
jgi:hypothetical protein